MLYGPESYLRDEALTLLLQAAKIEADDFDLEHFDADGTPPVQWLAAVGTAPFLAERRTVVVRHMFRSDSTEVQAKQLIALPQSSLLILVFDDEVSLDVTSAKARNTVSGWKKLVDAAKGTTFEAKVDAKAARSLLRSAIEASGRTITEGALNVLIEMCGSSLSHAREELDKLYVYSGKSTEIREADVRAIVVPSRDWNVFKMIDAIVARRASDALEQLRILVGSATKAEEAAFRSILPSTARQLRLFWQARACLDAKVPASDPPPHLAAGFPERPSLASEPSYRISSIVGSARNISAPQLARCFEILSDTDSRMKGILTSYSAVDTLERMVLEMCSALS